jgi:site-specific recombinase XerD
MRLRYGAPRAPRKAHQAAGTLAWLISRYREVSAWTTLSMSTRRQRETIFKQVIETAGNQPFTQVTAAAIMAGCERRSNTPSQARHFLDTMRGLFKWATKAALVKVDPTLAVDTPLRSGGDGFPAWTEDHVAAYQRRWPLGTRQRVWLDVLLYTGLRRGDAVRQGEKTNEYSY